MVEVVPGPLRALVAALAALGLILLGVAKARVRRRRRALRAGVGPLQAALLPVVPARVGVLAVSAAYRPADGPVAGGDFYDVFALPGERVALVVGDVSGDGRDALAPTVFLRHTLRVHLEAGVGLREALKLTNEAFGRAPIGRQATPAVRPAGRFATVLLAIFDPNAGTLRYAGAGHPPPIVVGTEARPAVTACSAPPLGLAMETGTRQTTISLPHGAAACLYTDGLAEARSAGRPMGDERLARLVAELRPEEGADALVDRVAAEADSLSDDLAVCVIRPLRPGPASAVRTEELEVGPAEPDAAGRFFDACRVPRAESAAALGGIADQLARGERVLLRVDLTGPRAHVLAAAGGDVALAARRG